ncbi:MAG: hypothetical protein K2O32_13645 [Acetatifactor sp.]|nr:hypothetical protein [Acetatifactor sp.]
MNLEQADKILHSNINKNCYYLFKDKIIVETERNKYQEILLPKDEDDQIVCFYDMYYEKADLIIIVASRDFYDRKFILYEHNLSIMFAGLTK